MFAAALAMALLALWLVAPKLHRFAYWAKRTDRVAIAATAPPAFRLDVLAVEPRSPSHGRRGCRGARALQRAVGAHATFVDLPGRGHVDYLAELAGLPAQRW